MRKKGESKTIIKAGVIIRYQKEILLIKERHNKEHPFRWNIVKGTFEPDMDKSIFDTAMREAWEETHTKIKLRYILKIYYLLDKEKSLTTFVFVADAINIPPIARRRQAPQANGEEISEIKLFKKGELLKLRRKDFVGLRGYLSIHDYIAGEKFSKKLITILPEKK